MKFSKKGQLISLVVMVLLSVLLIRTDVFKKKTDSLLLGNHNSYREYFATDKLEIRQLLKDAADDGESENLFINERLTQIIDGLSVELCPNGTLMVDGRYEGEDRYMKLSPDRFCLEEGEYFFSDGGFTKNAGDLGEIIVGGILPNSEGFRIERLVNPAEEHIFRTDKKYSSYWIGFRLAKGFEADHLVVAPLLYRVYEKTPEKSYSPCSMLFYTGSDERLIKYGIFRIPKKDFLNLSAKEKQQCRNNIEKQYLKNLEWVTIMFDDFTGIRFKKENNGVGEYGKADPLGQIYSEKYDLDRNMVIPD